MIADAAYFRAEKRGFSTGDTAQDWLDAEAEIDRALQTPDSKSKALPITAKQALAFQKKLETQVKKWDVELASLKTKAQKAKTGIKADYEKQIEMLAEKRDIVQAKMQELGVLAGDAWIDVKGSTEKIWEEMQKTLEHIAARFK